MRALREIRASPFRALVSSDVVANRRAKQRVGNVRVPIDLGVRLQFLENKWV